MKTGLSVLALTAAVFIATLQAQAADIINEDDAAYTLLVNGEMELNIEAASEIMAFCDACSVQLKGSEDEPLNVDETTSVFISKGKLTLGN